MWPGPASPGEAPGDGAVADVSPAIRQRRSPLLSPAAPEVEVPGDEAQREAPYDY